MTNSEMFYFTGKCLTLDENPGFRTEIIEKCTNDLIDWQHFVSFCSNQLILPVIYLKFKSHGIIEYLPEELSGHLAEIHELNVSRNKQILKQLQEITRVLNKSKIDPVFLKGAGYLLDKLYSDLGERILGDIDFLVPEKDYLVSARLLENEGYSKVLVTPGYTDVKSLKHYPRLLHPDFAAVIEIHRIPVKTQFLGWFNTEIIDGEKQEISALPGCYVQSDNHKIIHNFIHSQLANEGYLYGKVNLRELYDLYLLSKRYSIEEAIPGILPKQKAIAYFAYARKILALDESFFQKKNLSGLLLSKKHTLNLNSTAFYYFFRSTIFIAQRIFNGYLGQFIQSFYSKKMRQSVFRRLSDQKWYGDHLRLYTRFFNRNK